MIPQSWASSCGNECTQKYATLTKIPWRVFCKKGCDSDGETWEECVEDCKNLCYKEPVLKDRKWSAYIDRSPGDAAQSEACFNACASGCGFKFEIDAEEVEKVQPNNTNEQPPDPKPTPTVQPNPPSKAKSGTQ